MTYQILKLNSDEGEENEEVTKKVEQECSSQGASN